MRIYSPKSVRRDVTYGRTRTRLRGNIAKDKRRQTSAVTKGRK